MWVYSFMFLTVCMFSLSAFARLTKTNSLPIYHATFVTLVLLSILFPSPRHPVADRQNP